ncbi:MAG: alpha/beta hydrolase [Parvularculaceae bacterium]|nr:alpha/beta hydrolase [Parvularculaceae bacterium]
MQGLPNGAVRAHPGAMNGFPDPQFVDAGAVRLAAYQAGDGPPVILVHGWPEIAYSWKYQIAALADAGYRAIAPDLKGFGRSDAPKDKSHYDIRRMSDDLARMLDALDIERAVFCGHDWGGAIVWPMAQLHPARVAGVIGVCTPHRPPPPAPPLSIIEERFGPKHYFIQFQQEKTPEALFETDIGRFFRLMFRRPADRADIERLGDRIFDLPGRFRDGPAPDRAQVLLSDADIETYVAAYRRSGFTGGINLYRNIDRNYELMRDVDPVIDKPALMISAQRDYFLPPESADGIEKIVPNVERALIEDCGHWVTWEKPAELNRLILDWLARHADRLFAPDRR